MVQLGPGYGPRSARTSSAAPRVAHAHRLLDERGTAGAAWRRPRRCPRTRCRATRCPGGSPGRTTPGHPVLRLGEQRDDQVDPCRRRVAATTTFAQRSSAASSEPKLISHRVGRAATRRAGTLSTLMALGFWSISSTSWPFSSSSRGDGPAHRPPPRRDSRTRITDHSRLASRGRAADSGRDRPPSGDGRGTTSPCCSTVPELRDDRPRPEAGRCRRSASPPTPSTIFTGSPIQSGHTGPPG